MNQDDDRIIALDLLRGIAVLGILVMNMTAFSQPWMDYLNPYAGGGDSAADLLVWAVSFIFIDGKMRALFAMLLGASMLVVIERAEMDGRDGLAAHRRRMLWLMPIGLAHHVLVWDGDILLTLAIAGLIAGRMVHLEPMDLAKWGFGLIGLQFLISALFVILPFFSDGGSRFLSDPAERAAEIALMQGSWSGIAVDRLSNLPVIAIEFLAFLLCESLGFVLLGMALMKGGFLTGQWDFERYVATARHCAIVGLPVMAALAIWTLASKSDAVAQSSIIAWSLPFRIPLAIGYAAIIMALIIRRPEGFAAGPIVAVGRMTLTNYLACSIVMTSLFYGYGAGWFATLSRVEVLVPMVGMWIAMLVWSPLWLRAFRHGPAEWLWRSLTRGQLVPLRRS